MSCLSLLSRHAKKICEVLDTCCLKSYHDYLNLKFYLALAITFGKGPFEHALYKLDPGDSVLKEIFFTFLE